MSDPQVIIATPEQLKALIDEAVKKAMVAAGNGDRLIDPAEAAKLFSVSEDGRYHHAKKFPFTRKLGPLLLRFSYQGLLTYIESKKFEIKGGKA